MNTITPIPSRPGAPPSSRGVNPIGVRENAIEGRFRSISTHQLVLAWWLHTAGHLTRRQLRVYFAAHEMHERRRYTAQERGRSGRQGPRQAFYGLHELKTLVGGRGSPTADAELNADVRRLARLGLVKIDEHSIVFATSADQIAIDDLAGFWTMFGHVPNQGRSVPVPRRTLRALAGGFSRAVTGVMIALMIRSLFWHKEQGDYRIDGRTKGSWIADVFGLSRRAVTDARAHLMELGWLEPIEARQWELNRWGAHDRINVQWTPATDDGGGGEAGEIASPTSDNRAEIATPDLNENSSPIGESLNTRKLATASRGDGVSSETGRKGSRKKKAGQPRIASIEPEDLRDVSRLSDLYHQAVDRKLILDSEAGRLTFFSLAERARAHGQNPAKLFAWLLTHRKFEFITQADEDAAAARLRAMRNGPRAVDRDAGRGVKPAAVVLTEDERLALACTRAAQRHRLDPFHLARKLKPDWTRDRWDAAVDAMERKDLERWGDCAGADQ